MIRLVFGGAVAVILLGLYVYAIIYSILAVWCLAGPDCKEYSKDLTQGVSTVLNLVGGLVSALVITELAITKPNDVPAMRILNADTATQTDQQRFWAQIIAGIYLAVWLVVGVVSLIVGFMQHPEVVPTLTASAKSWLGLAVAAAYSYLGVNPK